MKTSIVYTIIALLMINTLSGQVKIGNNPESLDPASVLELESNTRVLVITRVTDAQMSVINPLPGALTYNTDQDCLHYYDGTQWVNICEELDNSFTVSTRADYLSQLNPQARDSTVIITTTVNPDDSVNYNFEVAQITGANIVNTSINGASKLQDDSVTSAKLADGSVTLEKLADATTGQPGDLFQWNGINWTLINESALGITEKDSIVGNEVVGPTDATLLLSGTGSQTDPLTLDVAPLGIDTAELADDAVTSGKINANVAGTGLSQAIDGSLEVDNANIAPEWTNITGIPADIDDGDNDTTYSAGTGIALAGTTFSIDNANIAPEWTNITGIPADIDDGDNDTTYSAGTGIALAGTTFSIDNANIAPEWTNITGIPADIDDGDNDTTYSAGTGIALVGTTFSIDDANIAPEWTNITGIPADIDDGDNDTTYSAGTGIALAGTTFSIDNANIAPEWTNITGIPADIDDGDNDTTYSAGTGIALAGTTFSIDNANIAPEWTNITGIPTDIDDGDNDTTYSAGTGINIDGSNTISTVNLVGDVVGPITATQIASGVITNVDINMNAAIEGTKIDPDFGTLDVATTGTLATGNTTITGTLSTTSTLQTGGSFSAPILSVNSNITLNNTHYTLILQPGISTVGLPASNASNIGRIYVLKNRTGGLVNTSINYINSTGISVSDISNVVIIQSDGAGNWEQIN